MLLKNGKVSLFPCGVVLLSAWLMFTTACHKGRGIQTDPVAVSTSAGGEGGETAAPEPGEDGQLLVRYREAVEAAKYPTASKIARDLTPISLDNPDLHWNDQGQVLMVTWTDSKWYPEKKGESFHLDVDTWFTAYPYMHVFCSEFQGGDLSLRIAQSLGLPPDTRKGDFVHVWVSPEFIFRPCPDPEIYDSQCLVRIPLLNKSAAIGEKDGPPWYCEAGPPPIQTGQAFLWVRQTHLDWMCANWEKSYSGDDPLKQYPWTALGYTYDWGNPRDPVGFSEYVVLKNTTVVFESKTPTATYCGR